MWGPFKAAARVRIPLGIPPLTRRDTRPDPLRSPEQTCGAGTEGHHSPETASAGRQVVAAEKSVKPIDGLGRTILEEPAISGEGERDAVVAGPSETSRTSPPAATRMADEAMAQTREGEALGRPGQRPGATRAGQKSSGTAAACPGEDQRLRRTRTDALRSIRMIERATRNRSRGAPGLRLVTKGHPAPNLYGCCLHQDS